MSTEQQQSTPLADMQFQVKIEATAEVRDKDGHLIDPDARLDGTEVLTGRQLAERYTDDELRAAGLSDTQVTELRGTQQEEQDR